MAPLKALPSSEEEAREDGLQPITGFFSVVRKRGRPKNASVPVGTPGAAVEKRVEGQAQASLCAPPAPKKAKHAPSVKPAAKASRTNWGVGSALKKLTMAVVNWDARPPDEKSSADLKSFAAVADIPYDTFKHYVYADKAKRRKLGKSTGPPRLVSKEDSALLADVARRRDRANDGMSCAQLIDALQDLMPALGRKQAENASRRCVRREHASVLTNIVKAQPSTTKRSAITVQQQWRWFEMVEAVLKDLEARNTGVCGYSGKTFKEVAHHFVFGGDESCLLASDGNVSIIGDKDKKKHETRSVDSRTSITLYRVGSVDGNGPTAFLMNGERRRVGYTDDFLVKHGAAVGSVLVMTESGYMTESAWDEIAPHMAKGIRASPYVAMNPDWWALKIVDGFGAHTSTLKAMQVYHDAKIMVLKEEGDSSHVNQAYDKFVARADKKTGRSLLSDLRRMSTITKGVVDQWGLVHVGLGMVRACTDDCWADSFRAVNLHLEHRVPFNVWCERIASYLQGGDTFKPDDETDVYAALPSFWRGMTVQEKKAAMATFDKFGAWTVECVTALKDDAHVPYADMQALRVGIEMAKAYPGHMELVETPPSARIVAPEVAAALLAKKPVDVESVLFYARIRASL